MWEAEDSIGYKTSLQLYEAAFEKYPDSIDMLGLYKASVLAGELGDLDKAFRYLTPLSEAEVDDYGDPTWQYIVGDYSGSEYKNLLQDRRWKVLQATASKKKKAFYQKLHHSKDEFFRIGNQPLDETQSPEDLYHELRGYHPYLAKDQRSYSIFFSVNDTSITSYFVHLPANYDPNKKYSMLVFLHGAVRYNGLADFQTSGKLGGWNRFYTKYAEKNDVILVFPQGSRQYNWMVPDDGFFMIPAIIREIKKSINIDDNGIFVSGHSNGATGSFSYLMKQPTAFAGFYGFNTYPKVFTGGTFVENILNRSYINFSTDEDYYYPPAANDSLSRLMDLIAADYEDHRYNGFPHWFPAFDESEPAFEILFADLATRKRDPFPNEITWELDDENYGNVDWLGEIKLDTLTEKAAWHRPRNFKIDRWLDYDDNDSLVVEAVEKWAFDFPRKSGKIQARYHKNTFEIKTSCIQSFQLRISPEMVDLNEKVKVFINGTLHYDQKIGYDKAFMLNSFEKNGDRTQVWVNHIDLRT